jgi:hypothetical protein
MIFCLGGGFAAYKHHQKAEEEVRNWFSFALIPIVNSDWSIVYLKKKAVAWALQNWIHDAQQRTAVYHRDGPQSPVTWILTHGKNIPPGAIKGGHDQGHVLYIARAFHDVSRYSSLWINKL